MHFKLHVLINVYLLFSSKKSSMNSIQFLLRDSTWTTVNCKSRTIQPKLDHTNPVKLAVSESAIQCRSDTDSDLPWTVRKYTSISKRKYKTLHKWCGACNSAVSGWHWLLSAVNQSRTSAASAVSWTQSNNAVNQSLSAWCICGICAANRCGPRY